MHRLHKLLLTLLLTYGATLVLSIILQPSNLRAQSDRSMLVQPFRVLARAVQSPKMSSTAGSEAFKKIPAGTPCMLGLCGCMYIHLGHDRMALSEQLEGLIG